MERRKKTRNIFSYLFFMVFSAVLYGFLIPSQIEISIWNKNAIFTAQTFPRLISIVIFFTSFIGLIKELILLLSSNKQREEKTVFSWKPFIRPFCIAVIAIIYYILFNRIGFVFSSILVIPAVLLVLGCRKWQYYLYVYLFSGVIYVIFVYVLKIMLP